MRIFGIMILTVFSMLTLTGCGNFFKSDDVRATVSITTTSGKAFVIPTTTDQSKALMHPIRLNLEKGDSAIADFECTVCKNNQNFKISTPWAKTLSCNCPDQMDNKGNKKEFITIVIEYGQKEDY